MARLYDPITDEQWARFDGLRVLGFSMRRASAICIKEFGLPHALHTLETYAQARRFKAEIDGTMPPEIFPEIFEEVVVPYEDCYILADPQLPHIHQRALTQCLANAKSEGITTAILPGDVLNNDAFSTYLGHTGPGSSAEYSAEVERVYRYLAAIAGVFDKVYWLRGNHDARILKALGKKPTMQHIAAMFLAPGPFREGERQPVALWPHFQIVERYYMVMTGSPTGDWRFTHQRNYSTIPGRVAQRLSAKQETNTLTAHEHGMSLSHSGTRGKYYAVACPCLCDPNKLEYKVMRDTLNPEMIVGWGVLRGGVPSVVHWEKEYGR